MSKKIDIDINKSGLSSNLGQKLEQIGSSQKLTDAEIAALCLSLTGSSRLYGAANLAYSESINAANSLMDLQTMVFNLAYSELENALSDSGVIGSIQDGVETASKTLALAKKGLQFVNSGASIAANISKIATLLQASDPDITVVPSVKDTISIIGASLIAILEAKFNEAKQQLIELYNSMICTSAASTVDNVLASINGILDKVEPLIEPYMEKYTGYTIAEVRYICNTGFALVNMMKRETKQAKTTIESEKQKNESIDYSGKFAKDYSKDQTKSKLVNWMNSQSFGLRNAFQLMMIKDCIYDIKISCQNLTNNTIENLADFVNATQVVFQIFELIGYQYGKEGITVSDLKSLSDAIKYTTIDAGQNITNQVQILSAKMRPYNASVKTIESNNSENDSITAYNISGNSINGTTTTINITLLTKPNSSDEIKSYIKSFKNSKNQTLFNAANRKKLKEAFENAWATNKETTETVSVKSDGVFRTYVFNISVDKDSYNANYNKIENNSDSESSLILDNISINVNMAYIEGVFANKVLLFDPIVKILDMMNPLIKILQTLCHLVENFQINTEFVRSKKHASLGNALRTAATVYNGLKDIIKLDNTNFFVIRTEKLALWAIKNLSAIPDKNGFATISVDKTNELYLYCTTHSIYPEYPISLLKGTTLYFDGVGIQDGDKQDGTSDGLDRIQINADNGEIYFDSSNRSIYASQILFANGNNKDPYYVKDLTNQIIEESDNSSVSDLFSSITINTDESEGSGAISLDDITCCQKEESLSTDDSEKQDVVIIEFGYEYTKGAAVDYTINVSPGQSINKDTILAYIHKDSKNIPVKSIYNSGTVMAANDDYFHIYPQNANRHIVIADASIAEPDFSIDDVSNLQAKMKDSTEMYQLIISLLLPSMYPIMLANANRNKSITISNVANSFNNINEDYNDQLNKRAEDLKNLSSKDSIGACSDNPNKLVDLKNKMLEIRNVSIYSDVLKYYNKALNFVVNGSYEYVDCMGLAYETPDYKNINIAKDSFGDGINTDLNTNYYVTLLSKITTRTSNKFAQEYFALIKNIIDNRLTEESIDANKIIAQFNKLYQCGINEAAKNGFQYVSNSGFANIDISDKDAVNNLITFLKREYLKYLICKESNPMIETNPAAQYKSQYLSLQSLAEAGQMQDSQQLDDLYDKVEQALISEDSEAYGQKLNILTAQLANIYIYACQAMANNKTISSGAHVKKIDSDDESLTRRLTTYKFAAERWITNNGGIITNIQNPYNQKTYLTVIDWLSAVYKEASRLHNDLTFADSLYVKDIDAEVKNQIVRCIFNNVKPDNIDSIYLNVFTPYRKQNSSTEIIESFNKDVNILLNEYYFELTCKEADQILAYWKGILDKYGTTNIGEPEGPWGEYNYKTVEKEIQDYANNLNNVAQWPESMQIDAGKYRCTLYTFVNRDIEKAEIPNIDLDSTDYNTDIPDAVVDYTQTSDLLQPKEGDITIMDYEYWLVYMLNASLVTLMPQYWADGFDIPILMTPTLLPAIYVPIAKPIKIPFVNVLIVVGIAIRGIWPAPIFLMVNMNNHDLNAMLPVMVALELSKTAFAKTMEKLENVVPETINALIDKASAENVNYRKILDKFRTYASVIRSTPIENKAIIESAFFDAVQKQRDKRQIITRQEDLGSGEEPL